MNANGTQKHHRTTRQRPPALLVILSCVIPSQHLACTPSTVTSSPEADVERTRRSVPQEIAPLPLQQVVDHAGRWKTAVEALEAPRVQTEPGYVRVTADLGTEQPFECFVYDEPFDAGQAMTQLFRAAEVGIDYTHFEVEGMEFIAGAPVIFITAQFVSSQKGAPRGGMMKVALSPRTTYPVFCSHEEPRLVESFPRVVRGLLGAMQPRSDFSLAGLRKADVPLVEETWNLRQEERRSVGFAVWRLARLPNGTTHSLHVTSMFVPQGEELITTDRVSSETEDATGLTLGRYLSVVGTQPVLELALVRTSQKADAFTYSVKGGADGKAIQTEFSTVSPLRSAARSFEVFRTTPSKEVEYLQFLPELEPGQATRVTVDLLSATEAEVRRGEHTQKVKLDELGLPRVVGSNGDAVLEERRYFKAPP